MLAARWAREKLPYLRVCLGMQCAVIKFSHNVLGWEGTVPTRPKQRPRHRTL